MTEAVEGEKGRRGLAREDLGGFHIRSDEIHAEHIYLVPAMSLHFTGHNRGN